MERRNEDIPRQGKESGLAQGYNASAGVVGGATGSVTQDIMDGKNLDQIGSDALSSSITAGLEARWPWATR